MSSDPLVTIVTPSFNQAQYLEQTICSVLQQDYPALEYMIVDGGSTDGSLEIIKRYADRLSWWVSEPDSGQAEAINKGLHRARGEFVAWLNSDDVYLPGAVGQAAASLSSNPELGLVYGDAITIDGSGKPIGRFAFEDWGLLDLISFRIICQPAVFMRRNVLEKAGNLERSFHYMLDHQLWIRIARLAPIQYVCSTSGEIGKPIEGLWAAARHHAGAKNVSQAAGFGRETLEVLAWMEAQPDLANLIMSHRRKVLAGANRLNARYLLDDGLPAQALASYLKSIYYRPGYAIKHAHRIGYALLSLLKLQGLVDATIEKQNVRRRVSLSKQLLQVQISPSTVIDNDQPYKLADWPFLSWYD